MARPVADRPTGTETRCDPVTTMRNRNHRQPRTEVHAYPVGMVAILIALIGLPGYGCRRYPNDEAPPREVVLYTSVDEGFARLVLAAFEKNSGVNVSVVFDSEAGKTTGLVNRIIREAQSGRPRADVFWSGELFNTILLARRGFLERYEPASTADIPERFRDPDRRWTALAVRARVLAFDPGQTSAGDLPAKWEELAQPHFAARTAIANPLFGTTRSHVAAMFAVWGPERARAWLTAVRDGGAIVADSNSATVRALSDGRAALAATDSDDVWVAQRAGQRLDLRYLDMGHGGTLLIPCSLAIIRGGPNPNEAGSLVDYLASAEVERMLAESDSRNVPVRAPLREALGMEWPPESAVDFERVADAMDEATAAVREILIR
jgi:iron(III) transport system substrate-binding protein